VERIKAVIEFYKTLFIISVTTFLSIVGYMFINYDKIEEFKKFLLFYSFFIMLIVSSVLLILWRREIEKLKDEDE
jgi:hypothetical protein